VKFVVDQMALEQVFLKVFQFHPLVTNIPALLHTHIPLSHEMWNGPDQAAHYHTLGPKLQALSLTQYLAGSQYW
jgi:hypothetical protein